MIALVHVDMVRRLDAVADVAPIAVADFHLHIAHHRARDPGDDAFEHVLSVELARRPPLAHRREAHDAQVLTLAHEFAIGDGRIRIGQGRLDEAVRADGDKELARFRIGVLGLRLALRIHGPGVVAASHSVRALLAFDGEAGATADFRVVPLNANLLFFVGLAGVVDGQHVGLQVRAVPIVVDGEILTEIRGPTFARELHGVHFACAHRRIGGLQEGSRILCRCWAGDQSRRDQQHSQPVSHSSLLVPEKAKIAFFHTPTRKPMIAGVRHHSHGAYFISFNSVAPDSS